MTGLLFSLSTVGFAQVQIGVGGVEVGMTPDQVSQVLESQGQRIFLKSNNYVEATLLDTETKATVRARFIFEDVGAKRLRSVEFVEDSEKFIRQYIRWRAKLEKTYGPSLSREYLESSQKDYLCHNRNQSIALALYEQKAVLAYFFNAEVSGNCQNDKSKRSGEAIAYDWRSPSDKIEVKAQSRVQVATSGEATAARPPEASSARPSPLDYATHRSQAYQDTLRCIGVAAFDSNNSSGSEQQGWKVLVRTLSTKLVTIGRNEGMSPTQVDAEGRATVSRNHGSYKQGKKDEAGKLYLNLDSQFCRLRGFFTN